MILLLAFFLFIGLMVVMIELFVYFVDDKKHMKDLVIEVKQKFKRGEKNEY